MEARIHESSLAASGSERTPLLRRHEEAKDQKAEVTPLKYGVAHPLIHPYEHQNLNLLPLGQISKAADTTQRAFVNDPIMIYYGVRLCVFDLRK